MKPLPVTPHIALNNLSLLLIVVCAATLIAFGHHLGRSSCEFGSGNDSIITPHAASLRVGGAMNAATPTPTSVLASTTTLWEAISALPAHVKALQVPCLHYENEAWNFALNKRHNYQLFTYGQSDFISFYCLRGGDNIFWEEHESDFIKALLLSAATSTNRKATGSSSSSDSRRDPFFDAPWFFDVGSNIGVHTVAVGAAGYGVIAIEANPETAARLSCSIESNSLASRVTLLNAAISGANAGASMCVEIPQKGNLGMAYVRSGECVAGMAAVPTLTFDTLFAALPASLPVPTVLKIDVEGMELLALRDGGSEWLSRTRPPFVLIEIEPTHLARTKTTFEDLIAFWLALGYHGWIPRGNTRAPTPEILLSDFDNAEKATTFRQRLASCNFDVFFTLDDAFPVDIPQRICSNS
jgi:FkbM family methyltransferase